MRFNKIENGRGMVEILAVLAVIGILSVAGVYGYRMAMTQHQANELWNEVMISAQVVRGMPDHNNIVDRDTKSFWLEPVGKYNMFVQFSKKVSSSAFTMTVSGVPTAVCEKVLQIRPNEMVGIEPYEYNQGRQAFTCQGVNGKTKITFYFDAPSICFDPCSQFYSEWQEKCGSEWQECNPDFGFVCSAFAYAAPCSSGAVKRFCNGLYYDVILNKWSEKRLQSGVNC